MNTVTFIGSDKNAGKTTALNHIYGHLRKRKGNTPRICLTSTGISGDRVDQYFGHPKPRIDVYKDTFVVTTRKRIETEKKQAFQVVADLSPPLFSTPYVMGRCIRDTALVLEGPNTREELIHMKEILNQTIAPEIIMVDGSADRQFVAHPWISDTFFFAVRLSDNAVDMGRTRAFLIPLSLPPCPSSIVSAISGHANDDIKSLLFDHHLNLRYTGRTIPFQDVALESHLEARKGQPSVLYLNGALSPTLHGKIRTHNRLTVVLDNFTLYQNIPTRGLAHPFLPALYLRYPVHINGMFVRNDTRRSPNAFRSLFPGNVPSVDLYKDESETVETVTQKMIQRIPRHGG